jgi:hypothetical protein
LVFFLRSLDLFWMYLYHAALTHFGARHRERERERERYQMMNMAWKSFLRRVL